MKKCEICGVDLGKCRSDKKYCKPCKIRRKFAQHCSANRDKVAERNRKYRAANKEKVIEYQREYRSANREKIAERNREYRSANREKIAERNREYRAANPEVYARSVLKRQLGFQPPEELVEVCAIARKIKRFIKENQNV